MYQKDLNMSYLLDFYGEAISPKHREILSQYYEEDLSLSEIAEIFEISRQGARHIIKKGEAELLFLEEKLGLAQIHKEATNNYSLFIEKMSLLEDSIENSRDREEIKRLFAEVKAAADKIRID